MPSLGLTSRLGGVVMGWTAFTTVFLWTPTMRGLFRPDISTWSVMGVEGTGRTGSFWVFPGLAVGALLVFYLYGRNRCRPLVHAFLVAWHGLLALIVVSGIVQQGPAAAFEGGMWGVRVPLVLLAVPFVGLFTLTVVWVVRERRSPGPPGARPWGAIDRRALALGVLLTPVAITLFRIGEGIDWPSRFATVATVFQWVLFTEALSGPNQHEGQERTPLTA